MNVKINDFRCWIPNARDATDLVEKAAIRYMNQRTGIRRETVLIWPGQYPPCQALLKYDTGEVYLEG